MTMCLQLVHHAIKLGESEHRRPCSSRRTACQASARHRRRGGSSGRIAQYAAGRGSRASVA